jgi:hypothetical protein
MIGTSRHCEFDGFRCGQLFMFLYMFLLVLVACTAQQGVLGSTQSSPISNGRHMQHSFVSDISHTSSLLVPSTWQLMAFRLSDMFSSTTAIEQGIPCLCMIYTPEILPTSTKITEIEDSCDPYDFAAGRCRSTDLLTATQFS